MNQQTLTLKQSDTGSWLYTLPGANRINSTVKIGEVDYPIIKGQRVSQSNAYKEQATYEYHYIVLKDVDTDLTYEEVLELGFPETVEMDVMTGHVEWDQA